ncbi:MAG: NPCBM/NEW2 domain-containing protein [Luteolibacter sp.]
MPISKSPSLALAFTVISLAIIHAEIQPPLVRMTGAIELPDLDLTWVDQTWGTAQRDHSAKGKPLIINNVPFKRGIGTHADSRWSLLLDGGARRFQAQVGVDDDAGKGGSVRFSVIGDGKELWNSGICKNGMPAVTADVDVTSVRYLTLVADGAGDGTGEDHADWAEPRLTGLTKRPMPVARVPGEEGLILPGRQWMDMDGQLIQAHGGGVFEHQGRYYWYGEDRSHGYLAIGVACYISDNLVRWKKLGIVLPQSAYNKAHKDKTICERPKVIFNPKTKQFVMWFHYDKTGYGDSQAGVAVASSPAGPFRYLGEHRPVAKSTYRDMNLFVDDDGQAYTIYSGEGNQTMHIARLKPDWTEEEKPMVEGKNWARILVRRSRESPALFKYTGKYYLITSATTGWKPNAADLAVADTVLGPYKQLGNPCTGPEANTTFRTQSTCILPAPGKPPGNFIYMGDRWKSESLTDSRYIWLPFQMRENGTTLSWLDSWKP